jgi:class I fructose-bisphosphate aldolase
MSKVVELLRDKACYYLDHTCETIDKSLIHVPSPDTIDKVWIDSDRNIRVLNSLQTLLGHGRLANTGYVSILPVDQDIEHTAGASFAPNPIYFDPENIVKLAIEGGCNGVASTFGILGSVARKYAHKIPFIVKLNHNELLSYPNTFDQVLFGTVKEAWNMGAVAGPPSISVRNRAAVSSWRLPKLLNMLTNWGWQPFFGVTCVIMISRKVLSIIMRLPI